MRTPEFVQSAQGSDEFWLRNGLWIEVERDKPQRCTGCGLSIEPETLGVATNERGRMAYWCENCCEVFKQKAAT